MRISPRSARLFWRRKYSDSAPQVRIMTIVALYLYKHVYHARESRIKRTQWCRSYRARIRATKIVSIVSSSRVLYGLRGRPTASTYRVLRAEDETASDASDTAKTCQRRAAESSFPLSTNVVGLVGHRSRDIRIGARSGEENTEISDGTVLREAQNWEANQSDGAVEDNHGCSHPILVAEPGGAVHQDDCHHVRWSAEGLRCSEAEAEGVVQDDGKEEGEGVRDCCGAAEEVGSAGRAGRFDGVWLTRRSTQTPKSQYPSQA